MIVLTLNYLGHDSQCSVNKYLTWCCIHIFSIHSPGKPCSLLKGNSETPSGLKPFRPFEIEGGGGERKGSAGEAR